MLILSEISKKIQLCSHLPLSRVIDHHYSGVATGGVLRNFAKFTGKHLCQSTFFNKVAGLRPTVSNSKKYLLSNAMSRRAKQQGLTSSLNFMNLKKFCEIAFGFFGDW